MPFAVVRDQPVHVLQSLSAAPDFPFPREQSAQVTRARIIVEASAGRLISASGKVSHDLIVHRPSWPGSPLSGCIIPFFDVGTQG
jgi:hypothetical protein